MRQSKLEQEKLSCTELPPTIGCGLFINFRDLSKSTTHIFEVQRDIFDRDVIRLERAIQEQEERIRQEDSIQVAVWEEDRQARLAEYRIYEAQLAPVSRFPNRSQKFTHSSAASSQRSAGRVKSSVSGACRWIKRASERERRAA